MHMICGMSSQAFHEEVNYYCVHWYVVTVRTVIDLHNWTNMPVVGTGSSLPPSTERAAVP